MKVIYFDFFGVISTPAYMTVVKENLPPSAWEGWLQRLDVLDAGKTTEDALVLELSTQLALSPSETWERIKNAPRLNDRLLEYIEKELIDSYQLGLLTNATRSLIDRILGTHIRLFSVEIVSADIGLIKPDPRIFDYAITQANVPAEDILFIDDNPTNIAIAKTKGMKGITYTGFSQFVTELATISA